MHDPDTVVYDLSLPIPRLAYRVPGKRWAVRVRRRTNRENFGQRVESWYWPRGYDVRAFGRQVRLIRFATVWHHEPGGEDSGEVCGWQPSGSTLTLANVAWSWRHRDHVTVTWQRPGARLLSWWRTRCTVCGERFAYWDEPYLWEPRFRGWPGDGVRHERCRSNSGDPVWRPR